MNENQKYTIIKQLVDSTGNKATAALKIGYSPHTVNRLIKSYKEEGKAFFIHGNRGRQPISTILANIKHIIVDLYLAKYCVVAI